MALKQWLILNPDGAPSGTQVCEGASCFPTLQPGQSRVAMAAGADGTTPAGPGVGGITTIDPSGRLVQPQRALPDLAAPEQPTVMNNATAGLDPRLLAMADAAGGVRPNPNVATDFSRASDVSQVTTPTATAPMMPTAMPHTAAPAQSYAAPQMGNVPSYQNGMRHPAAGGSPLTPGGAAAHQGSGGYRPTISNSSGAAGPWGARVNGGASSEGGNLQTARPTYATGAQIHAAQQRNGYSPPSDKGSHRSPQYNAIRAKGDAMAAKVRAMAGNLRNGGGGGYSSSSGGGGYSSGYSSSAYRPAAVPNQKKIDKASAAYYALLSHPPPQKAHGWAKHNLGKNHGTYPALLTDPLTMMAKPLGIDPFKQSGTYDWMDSMPVADLAMIDGGGMSRKSYTPKVPGILKKAGFKPNKPDFKKELDYSKYAAQLRDVYNGLNGSDYVLDKDHLMGQLANGGKNTALRQGLTQQVYYGDPGGALDRAKGYFHSVFDATEDDLAATVHSRMADRYFAQAGVANRGAQATGGGKTHKVINQGRGGRDFSHIVNDVSHRFGY